MFTWVLQILLLQNKTRVQLVNLQAGLVAYLEGQLHGGALEEGSQTYPGYLVLVTSGVGLLLSSKARDAGLLNSAHAGILNSIYTAKLALLILPQVNPCRVFCNSCC